MTFLEARWAGCLLTSAMALASLSAQQAKPVGTVAAADASVTSTGQQVLKVAGGRVTLSGNSAVTANPGQNAEITLTRGGVLLVCQTSGLHLSAAAGPAAGSAADALLLALDRGAIEVRMKATPQDVVITPDLRFTLAEAGTLDLRMRVTNNGDTCVENRGHKAPALNISDAFGETSYLLKPGQHVMFEHGSLREVVDRETTPCGCPPATVKRVPLGEAVLAAPDAKVSPKQAEAANPFPVAESSGLAAPAPLPPEKPNETHVSASETLVYDAGQGRQPAPPDAAAGVSGAPSTAAAQPALPAQETQKRNPLQAIGHFFKRIFVR